MAILLIENDDALRETMAQWLEQAGYDVRTCPGPHAPDYTCLGGRGLPCPLIQPAGTVVLDMHLASDELMRGTPAWHLLAYYVSRGKRVVALVTPSDYVHPTPDDDVTVIPKPVLRERLLAAVRSASTDFPWNGAGIGDDLVD